MNERRGGWPGPRKIQKVVPQHPDQVAAVETYAEREEINYAEAMRRLVDVGLQVAIQDKPTYDLAGRDADQAAALGLPHVKIPTSIDGVQASSK